MEDRTMKKSFLLFTALGLVAISSCNKTEKYEGDPHVLSMTICADVPESPFEGTKVGLSGDRSTGVSTYWESDDKIGVDYCDYSTGTATKLEYSQYGFTSWNLVDGKGYFYGDIYCSAGFPTTKSEDDDRAIVAYTPYTANIPSSQTMNGTSIDKKAAVMISKPKFDLRLYDAKNQTTLGYNDYGKLEFTHIGTFLNIYVKELTASTISGDETVTTVTISAPGKLISGKFNRSYGDRDGESAGITMIKDKAYSLITVTVPEGTKLSELSAMAVAAPFSLAGEQLEITIDTDKHSLKKAMTLTRDFESGRLTSIGFKVDKSLDKAAYIKLKSGVDPTLVYERETKSFEIDANVPWTIDTGSLPDDITVVKDRHFLKATRTYSQSIAAKSYPIKLVGTGGVTATINIIQKSAWTLNEGCVAYADGSVLMGNPSSRVEPKITHKEPSTYYKLDFYIGDSKNFTDATSPMFEVKTRTDDGLYQGCYIGGGSAGNFFIQGDENKENGISTKSFGEEKWCSASDFNTMKEIYVSCKTFNGSGKYNYSVSFRVDFNDDKSPKITNADPTFFYWREYRAGELIVTLKDCGKGSFVIKSCESKVDVLGAFLRLAVTRAGRKSGSFRHSSLLLLRMRNAVLTGIFQPEHVYKIVIPYR